MTTIKGEDLIDPDKVLIRVTLTFDDGLTAHRYFNIREVTDNLRDGLATPPDFITHKCKEWPEPQGPLIFYAKVEPGFDFEAKQWLEAL